ncbi:hypothetical protein D4Q76_02355 [archaeon]|nr:MAG: hypothetical protein D4Q76_02355 [archaeon]
MTTDVQLNIPYLIGVILSDGGIYKYPDKRGPKTFHYQTDFTGDESLEFVKQIADMAEKIFKTKIIIHKHSSANCYYASSYKKEIFESLFKLGIPAGNKTLKAEFPQKLSLKEKIEIVKGIFDSEGWIYFRIERKRIKSGIKEYKYPVIAIKVSSEKFRNDISDLLKEIGIYFTQFSYPSKNRYEIHLRKFGSIKLFSEMIGFRHPRKKDKLKAVIGS